MTISDERLAARIAICNEFGDDAEGEVIDALRELQYRRAQAQPEPKHQTPENTAEPPAQSSAAPAPAAEPTITVSGPTACDKSFVMELIYKALRDAGLHPYSYELAHERRMVQEQPPPSTKVWHLREAVAAPQPAPAPAAEPVAWRKDLNPPHGNWTLIWQADNPWPGQFHVSALYAAPPPDEARELLVELFDEWVDDDDQSELTQRVRAYLEKHK